MRLKLTQSPTKVGVEVGTELGNNFVFSLTRMLYPGLAAGTILYAVMFEILQREKEKDVSGLVQLVAIMVGFSAMMTLQILGQLGNY